MFKRIEKPGTHLNGPDVVVYTINLALWRQEDQQFEVLLQ